MSVFENSELVEREEAFVHERERVARKRVYAVCVRTHEIFGIFNGARAVVHRIQNVAVICRFVGFRVEVGVVASVVHNVGRGFFTRFFVRLGF